MGRIINRIVNGVSDVLSAPSVLKSKVKGALADNKRGNLLYKQGYGKYYDSAGTIARKGKSNTDRHAYGSKPSYTK